MNKAITYKHTEGYYCLNYMKFFSKNHNIREDGIERLSKLKAQPDGALYLKNWRCELDFRVSKIKLNNPNYIEIQMFYVVNDKNGYCITKLDKLSKKIVPDVSTQACFHHEEPTIIEV